MTHDSEPLPLTLYGAADCDDTERTRDWLRAWGVPFREVSIDGDAAAERFVLFINGGYRSTPTLVFGAGRFKLVLTEPEEPELRRALAQAGHAPGARPR